MQFVMLTYATEQGAEAYDRATPDEVAPDIKRHEEWFAANADSIGAGYHLSWPRRWGRIAHEHQMVIHDGPFGESKEALGGVIVLTADTLEDALAIADTWPSFDSPYGAAVEVHPLWG